jgi:hypothetical protein
MRQEAFGQSDHEPSQNRHRHKSGDSYNPAPQGRGSSFSVERFVICSSRRNPEGTGRIPFDGSR